jgi:hypothetical protein
LRYTRFVASVSNSITVLDTSPTVPRQIYVLGTVNTATPSAEAVLVTMEFDDMDAVSGLLRLRNFWKSDECINIESGVVTSGPIQPGWWSAQWMLVLRPPTNGDPVGQNVFWIQNRWKPDEYLNIESGGIQSTQIQPGWLSARWTFEQVPGTNLYRIRNVWQPSEYLNIEGGALVAGPIQPGWWSAMWTLELI